MLLQKKRREAKVKGQSLETKKKGKSNKYANIECHYCRLKGHTKKYCKKLKRDNKKNGEKKNNTDKGENHIVIEIIEDYFVVLCDDLINVTCNKTNWIVDNGAIIHATS